MNHFNVAGRTAVITGAASGLGRAFALALSEADANVIAVDRDIEGLAQTQALAASQGKSITSFSADLADSAAVDTLMTGIKGQAETIDILINNAGIATLPGRTHEIQVVDWDRALAINLRSMFLVTRAILPVMLKRKSGTIINLSSYLGIVGAYPGHAITAVPYGASKAGVIGFTRQVAIEYAADNIRANAIAPGWHGGTRLGRERLATATSEDRIRFETFIEQVVPMGRRGAPEELCGLVLYLASDASSYMTGQVLTHDGGVTAA